MFREWRESLRSRLRPVQRCYQRGVLSIVVRQSGHLKEVKDNPPNCPPTSVLLVLKLKFYTKIFALYSWR